jgi:5-methylcytosine-specific restriction endonuclease McrA
MSSIGPKLSRLRLDQEAYEALRQRVLRRDAWRCQLCGAMANLEVHHQEFRSHAGHDSEENLITLCIVCHGSIHVQKPLRDRCSRSHSVRLSSRRV